MRKKIIYCAWLFLACSATFASVGSVIELAGRSEIPPAGKMNIALDPLIKNAEYDVSCNIINITGDAIDINLALDTQNGTTHSAFILNDVRLSNNQGQLSNGDNLVMLRLSTKENGNAIAIRNLDFNHAVQLSHCQAKPAIRQQGIKTALLDYYYAYNDTDKTFDISVGSFLPSTKTITPHSWVTIWDTGSETHIKNLR